MGTLHGEHRNGAMDLRQAELSGMARRRFGQSLRLLAGVMAVSLAPIAVQAGEIVQIIPADRQAQLIASGDPALVANKRTVFDLWQHLQAGRVGAARQLLADVCVSRIGVRERACGEQILTKYVAKPMRGGNPRAGALVGVIAEGDLVLVERLNVLQNGAHPGVSYENVDYDLFRLSGGKVVAHWASPRISAEDLAAALKLKQSPPPAPPGGAGSDSAPVSKQPSLLASNAPAIAANKHAVFDYWRVVLSALRADLAPNHMTSEYIQHNPAIPSGRDPLLKMLGFMGKPMPDIPVGIDGLKFVIAERDLVAFVFSRRDNGADTTAFDVFRVTDGKVAEHWDSVRAATDVGVRRGAEAELSSLLPPPPPPPPPPAS